MTWDTWQPEVGKGARLPIPVGPGGSRFGIVEAVDGRFVLVRVTASRRMGTSTHLRWFTVADLTGAARAYHEQQAARPQHGKVQKTW